MNGFDAAILGWLNHFARRWPLLDSTAAGLLGLDLYRGGVFVLGLAWIWAGRGPEQRRNREIVIAALVGATIAMVAGRLLAALLPFRPRPSFRTDFTFVIPYGFEPPPLRLWSAFPSDHAMIFAALATGMIYARRSLGLAAHAYALLVIGLGRVYVGLHHPTDVLAGVVLGVLVGVLVQRGRFRARVAGLALGALERRPRLGGVLAALLLLQLGVMFEDARGTLRLTYALSRGAICAIAQRGCGAPPPAQADAAHLVADPMGEPPTSSWRERGRDTAVRDDGEGGRLAGPDGRP